MSRQRASAVRIPESFRGKRTLAGFLDGFREYEVHVHLNRLVVQVVHGVHAAPHVAVVQVFETLTKIGSVSSFSRLLRCNVYRFDPEFFRLDLGLDSTGDIAIDRPFLSSGSSSFSTTRHLSTVSNNQTPRFPYTPLKARSYFSRDTAGLECKYCSRERKLTILVGY